MCEQLSRRRNKRREPENGQNAGSSRRGRILLTEGHRDNDRLTALWRLVKESKCECVRIRKPTCEPTVQTWRNICAHLLTLYSRRRRRQLTTIERLVEKDAQTSTKSSLTRWVRERDETETHTAQRAHVWRQRTAHFHQSTRAHSLLSVGGGAYCGEACFHSNRLPAAAGFPARGSSLDRQ